VLPAIVDGATRVLGIVGDPIAQVRSPPLWSALFRKNEINAVCVPFHVRPGDLSAFVSGLRPALNVLGLLVTVPHKAAAASLAHLLTDRAQKVGTANLLRPTPDGRWEGDILDGVGFLRALEATGRSASGGRALVVGAGGVGSAIAFALADAGAIRVDVSDIDPTRAAALSRRLAVLSGLPTAAVPARAEGYDLVVNASPMGMRPDDPPPIDLAGLTGSEIVADVVISATLTPILTAAKALGCHVQRGSAMTDHQVADMAAFLGLETGLWDAETARSVLGEV
jgi:shikimate dehydrogenase